jgi:hypothetical protein
MILSVVGPAPETPRFVMRVEVAFPRIKSSVTIENKCSSCSGTELVFKSVLTFGLIILLLTFWSGMVGMIDVRIPKGTRRIDLLQSLCSYNS